MSISERKIWVDGALRPWAEATVHVMSQSAQRGSLIFDVMSCHWHDPAGPAVFGLREHVARFVRSARLSRMRLGLCDADVIKGIGEAVRANPGATLVKVSGYYPGVSFDLLPRDARASVSIAAFDAQDLGAPPAERPEALTPARLQVAETRKMPGWVLSPQAKLAAGYLYTSIAKSEARASGFDDVLLLDEHGCIAESSTQSFFWVEDDVVFTAPTEVVLAGITRMALLEVARDCGLVVREESVPSAALERAGEAFMSGTSVPVWPVAQIGDRRFEAVPGGVTKRLTQAMGAMLRGEHPELSPRWLQPV